MILEMSRLVQHWTGQKVMCDVYFERNVGTDRAPKGVLPPGKVMATGRN